MPMVPGEKKEYTSEATYVGHQITEAVDVRHGLSHDKVRDALKS